MCSLPTSLAALLHDSSKSSERATSKKLANASPPECAAPACKLCIFSCCCCSLIVGIVSCALVLALVGSFRTTGGFNFVAEPALGNAVALCEREGVCDGPVVFEVLRPLPLEVLLEMLLLFTCMPLLFSADVFMSADIFSELPFGVIVETVVGTCGTREGVVDDLVLRAGELCVSSDGEKSVLRRQTRPLFGEGVKSRGVDMCGRFRSLEACGTGDCIRKADGDHGTPCPRFSTGFRPAVSVR